MGLEGIHVTSLNWITSLLGTMFLAAVIAAGVALTLFSLGAFVKNRHAWLHA